MSRNRPGGTVGLEKSSLILLFVGKGIDTDDDDAAIAYCEQTDVKGMSMCCSIVVRRAFRLLHCSHDGPSLARPQ